TRSGSAIAGSYSFDGSSWTQVGSTSVPTQETGFINMDDGFAGLIVTSHDDTVLNESVFDSVAIAASAGGGGNLLVSSGFEEYNPPALSGAGWFADPGRQVLA